MLINVKMPTIVGILTIYEQDKLRAQLSWVKPRGQLSEEGFDTHIMALKRCVNYMLFRNRTYSCLFSFQKFLRMFIVTLLNGLTYDCIWKEYTSYRKKGLVTHPRALKQRVIDMLFRNRTYSSLSSFQKFLRIYIFHFLKWTLLRLLFGRVCYLKRGLTHIQWH